MPRCICAAPSQDFCQSRVIDGAVDSKPCWAARGFGLRTSGETLKLSPTALSASISFLPVWLCCRNVIIPFIIFISSLCCYLPQKHVWAQAQFGVIDGSRKSVLRSGLLYDSDWGPHCKFLIGPLDKKGWGWGAGGGGILNLRVVEEKRLAEMLRWWEEFNLTAKIIAERKYWMQLSAPHLLLALHYSLLPSDVTRRTPHMI